MTKTITKKVLVADDNQRFLMSLLILLKRLGFRVIPADDGIEVLKITKLSEPDLVILDVNMETMDGITVLRYLKADKKTAHIPIIVISADVSEGTVGQCKALGCSAFLSKPLNVKKLRESLEDCLFSGRSLQRDHLRISFNKKILVACNGAEHELFSETLSERGVYLRIENPFEAGAKVGITLPWKEDAQMHLTGTVIYTQDLFHNFLEFEGLTKEDVVNLRAFIEEQLIEDITL